MHPFSEDKLLLKFWESYKDTNDFYNIFENIEDDDNEVPERVNRNP